MAAEVVTFDATSVATDGKLTAVVKLQVADHPLVPEAFEAFTLQ
jgi:hypothetical protein